MGNNHIVTSIFNFPSKQGFGGSRHDVEANTLAAAPLMQTCFNLHPSFPYYARRLVTQILQHIRQQTWESRPVLSLPFLYT